MWKGLLLGPFGVSCLVSGRPVLYMRLLSHGTWEIERSTGMLGLLHVAPTKHGMETKTAQKRVLLHKSYPTHSLGLESDDYTLIYIGSLARIY